MTLIDWLSDATRAALAAALLLATLLAVRALLRARQVRPGTWVVVELAGRLAEVPPVVTGLRRWFARPRAMSVLDLRRLVRRVARDRRVAGVLVRLGDVSCGWATAQSLRDVLAALRAAGKRVVVYLPHGGMTLEVFVAVGADAVYAPPQAGLAPLGVASGRTFYRTLLARSGVEAEVLARREFKSAVEPFTRDGLSEENRLQTTALLEAVHDALVRALVEGRALSDDEARRLVDGGPYRAREAVAARLIDAVAYDDELPPLLGDGRARLVKAARYMALTRPALARLRRRGRRRRVGIVEVHGPIVTSARVTLGRVADAARVIGALRAARANPRVGAVVLHVDSPGGGVLASDLIAREVERLREKKPVVAYFGDVAASGGYYASAMANEIVAQPLTVTGSIGVFALRFVLRGAVEKLGLTHEVIRRGARADMMSPYRRWTEDERAALDREIDGFYTDFVGLVARGRRRPPEQVEPLARGRVYAGRDAHAVGLVDVLGGLDVAVARAAALAKLDRPGLPVLVHPPREMPEAPEPPTALQPIVAQLGPCADLVTLALNADRELLYAFDSPAAQ